MNSLPIFCSIRIHSFKNQMRRYFHTCIEYLVHAKRGLKYMKNELLKHIDLYCQWLEELKQVSDSQWFDPIEKGKWSTAASITHILFWDQHTLTERIPNMKEGVELQPYPDFHVFNEKAEKYAHSGVTKEEIITQAIETKRSIHTYLSRLDEKQLVVSFLIGEHPTTIEGYFVDFMHHDRHHQKQIHELLQNSKYETI